MVVGVLIERERVPYSSVRIGTAGFMSRKAVHGEGFAIVDEQAAYGDGPY